MVIPKLKTQTNFASRRQDEEKRRFKIFITLKNLANGEQKRREGEEEGGEKEELGRDKRNSRYILDERSLSR